jgi:hypothetical protein
MDDQELRRRRERGARIVLSIVLGVCAVVALYIFLALLLVAFGVWGGK